LRFSIEQDLTDIMRLTLSLLLAVALSLSVTACSDGSDQRAAPPLPRYDFSAVDARLQRFLDESERYDGISITLVDAVQGTVHEAAFGDHTTGIVVLLASASKMPTATLLMALADDPQLDFDVTAPIARYLPWEGVYGDRTTVQLVSNTSGIPGLSALADLEGDLGSLLAHSCQFFPRGTLEQCGRIIYGVELPGTVPPDTKFDYGGSQWQLAGAVAEQVSNSSWRQAFDRYIAGPCGLEVFQYGNSIGVPETWTGHPDSLVGLDNPSIEGGAISSLQDYATILLLHLRGGRCGDQRVIAEESVAFMQIDRGGRHGTPYGMGWWITPAAGGGEPTLFWDPGAFGSVAWIDTARRIGGFVAIDDYSNYDGSEPTSLVLADIVPLVAAAVDAAREVAAGE
jgi:CubicO group peptidase (beta-lactamase class C family)